MQEFKSDKKIQPDKQFGDFILRTRVRYFDEKTIADGLSDIYRMPEKLNTVIDVGANIGIISLMSAKRGARVYAFEPEQLNYETLEYNVKVNNFEDKIECINLGVGIPGEHKLFIHERISGATSTKINSNTGLDENRYQIIKLISIQDVFDNYNIEHCDLLKLDCEGSEEDIIRDFNDEIANKINQISLEFHNKRIKGELIEILSKWYIPEHLKKQEWVFRKKV